jgi:methionyl aminopeptidase
VDVSYLRRPEDEAHLREGLRAAGAVVARTLRAVARELKAGVTTLELDDVARYTFARYGARSAPQLDVAYPATICISVNDEAVHGIPGPRTIAEGDLVTIDVTAELDGFYADAAVTHAVEPVPARAERLKRCAEAAFHKGAAQARSGVPLWKVGQEIDREVRRRGFRVLKELCGHDVSSTEGREKLSLGLKAMRVLGIAAPSGPAAEPGTEAGQVRRSQES